MLKHKTLFMIIIVISLLFSACSNTTSSENVSKSKTILAEKLSGYKSEIILSQCDFVVALIDNSIIFGRYGDNSTCTYTRYFIDSAKEVELGVVKNFFLCNDSTSIIDHHLYTYITTNTGASLQNHLYEIDLHKNKLNEIYSETIHQTLVFTSEVNGYLMSLKGVLNRDTNDGITYIEKYSSRDTHSEAFIEYIANHSNRIGEAIINFDANHSLIYCIVEKFDTMGVTAYINIYNLDKTLNKSINASNIQEDILNQGIDEIKVINKYVFIRNNSGNAFIGHIDDNIIRTIVPAQNELEIAHDDSSDTKTGIFFIRGTNEILLLNPTNGEIRHYEFDVGHLDRYITYILSDNQEHIAILMKSTSNTQSTYIYYLKTLDLKEK